MMNRILVLFLACFVCSTCGAADTVRVQGAVSVALAMLDSVKILQEERDLTVQISVGGGSVGGLLRSERGKPK